MSRPSTKSKELQRAFAQRMLDGLITNNVLRGVWAEQVAGFYLGSEVEYAEQWNYFDFKVGNSRVSVKHSVNPSARFSVARKALAFDTELGSVRGRPPYTIDNPEGWRGHQHAKPQHWCDLYLFAWLPDAGSGDLVLDPAAWRFTAMSRADMYACFPESAKTAGLSTMKRVAPGFVEGQELARLTEQRLVARMPDGVDIPAIDMRTQEEMLQSLQ